jgi:GT2 family glycosyltransferase
MTELLLPVRPRESSVNPAPSKAVSVGHRPDTPAPVSVAIPTYGRDEVLVNTVAAVLRLQPGPQEILVIDQTPEHDPATAGQLERWQAAGAIRWFRLERPSIPAAMNRALREARCPVVLFLDDDVVPQPGLIAAHLGNYREGHVGAVVGQVLQPGQQPVPGNGPCRGRGLLRDLRFPFNSDVRREVANCMAGNLSVRREFALRVGGFDENYVGVAYRFETEFCRRLRRHGGTMIFEPAASLRHLQAPRGGTRAYGCHLRSARPEHAVGDYYFALHNGTGPEAAAYIARRFFREVRTRFHLTHPWWIPVKLLGELRGLCWALRLAKQGPRFVSADRPE